MEQVGVLFWNESSVRSVTIEARRGGQFPTACVRLYGSVFPAGPFLPALFGVSKDVEHAMHAIAHWLRFEGMRAGIHLEPKIWVKVEAGPDAGRVTFTSLRASTGNPELDANFQLTMSSTLSGYARVRQPLTPFSGLHEPYDTNLIPVDGD